VSKQKKALKEVLKKIRKGVAGRTVYQANFRHVRFAVETGREGV